MPKYEKFIKPKIIIEDLRKSFSGMNILNGVSAVINDSDSVVIIGGSGTGKSVFIKILSGLLEKDSGVVKIDGIDISNEKLNNVLFDQIGFLFQGGALFDSMKVWENVSFKLINKYKINRKKARDLAIEKLEVVGLKSNVLDLSVSELSGGMQKRVSFARTIATDPKIIFFDEPTTGLDPVMSEVVNDLILKCSSKLNATTITITHDMNSVKKIAKRIFFLYKGSFIWTGSKDDLDNSGNSYLNQFVKGSLNGPMII